MTDEQEEQAEHREAINREKGTKVDTPTTVEEQVEQLDDSGDDHRRRDPLAGAEEQRRDDSEE